MQYQRQKLIQQTVRVASSLYTMNLAALSAYQYPSDSGQWVDQAGFWYYVPKQIFWNQMSDRAQPSKRMSVVRGSNSTKYTIPRKRPGALSAGGIGVDIKHNSYNRYLNRLKGQSVLRRGIIPATYGEPIPFNCAYPVYGGKDVKTAIISNCRQCIQTNDYYQQMYLNQKNHIQQQLLSVVYQFHVGDQFYIKQDDLVVKCTITAIDTINYTVSLTNGSVVIVNYDQLIIDYQEPCKVEPSLAEQIVNERNSVLTDSNINTMLGELDCNQLVLLSQNGIL